MHKLAQSKITYVGVLHVQIGQSCLERIAELYVLIRFVCLLDTNVIFNPEYCSETELLMLMLLSSTPCCWGLVTTTRTNKNRMCVCIWNRTVPECIHEHFTVKLH